MDTEQAISSGLPDEEMVESARAGGLESLNTLYARHWQAFLACANDQCRRGCGWDEAPDLCQIACLKSVARLADLRDPARFRSWVMGFIANEARNLGRAMARHRKLFGTSMDEQTLESQMPVIQTESSMPWADRVFLRKLLAESARKIEVPCLEVANFMLQAWQDRGELPTVRDIEKANNLSHGAAQRCREAALGAWRAVCQAFGITP